MRKIIILLSLLKSIIAAPQTEIYFGGGAATFLGDLGGNSGIGRTFIKDFQASQIRPAFFVSFGKDRFSVNYFYTNLVGADSVISPRNGAEISRLVRNYWFSTPLHEFTVTGRQHLGRWYLLAGGGAFVFKPTNVERKVKPVQPLIVYGAGIELPYSEDFVIRFGITGRQLFTDYVDNVSLRGNLKNNDTYFAVTVGVAWLRPFRRDKYGCPIVY